MEKSIKNIFKSSAALVLLLFALTGCTTAQRTINLSTDKAVLDYLETQRKQAFSREKICIGRVTGWEKTVIVIGYSGSDSGCRLDSALIDDRYYELPNADLSKIALGAIGWVKADRTKREGLAKLWVHKGLMAFTVRDEHVFAAVSTADGGVKVNVSLDYGPGVTSRNVPKIFVFDKDGRLLPGRTVEGQ
jgi:hypothetical protein